MKLNHSPSTQGLGAPIISVGIKGRLEKKLEVGASFLKNGGLIWDGSNDSKRGGGVGWVGPMGAG